MRRLVLVAAALGACYETDLTSTPEPSGAVGDSAPGPVAPRPPEEPDAGPDCLPSECPLAEGCVGPDACHPDAHLRCTEGAWGPPDDEETCNGIDDDCDGVVDEDCCPPMQCHGPDGACFAFQECHPDQPGLRCWYQHWTEPLFELCGDGVDDDCDGAIDEPGCVCPQCTAEDGTCVGDGLCHPTASRRCSALCGDEDSDPRWFDDPECPGAEPVPPCWFGASADPEGVLRTVDL